MLTVDHKSNTNGSVLHRHCWFAIVNSPIGILDHWKDTLHLAVETVDKRLLIYRKRLLCAECWQNDIVPRAQSRPMSRACWSMSRVGWLEAVNSLLEALSFNAWNSSASLSAIELPLDITLLHRDDLIKSLQTRLRTCKISLSTIHSRWEVVELRWQIVDTIHYHVRRLIKNSRQSILDKNCSIVSRGHQFYARDNWLLAVSLRIETVFFMLI